MNAPRAPHAEVVSVSLPPALRAELDRLVEAGEFASRSEAVQLAVRELLAESRAPRGPRAASAVVSVCFSDRLEKAVAVVKHAHADVVRSMVHTHLEGADCVEVFIASGPGTRIDSLVRALRGVRGMHLVRTAEIPRHTQ